MQGLSLKWHLLSFCEPKLDVNIDSLVDRISKLERAVNRGVNVSQQPAVVEGAKPVVAESKQEVKAEKAVEEIKNDTVPPITSSKPSIEPKALQGKKETAVNKPQQTVNTDDSNTQYEFEHWGDFMDVIHKQNIALFGVLAGSRGYIRGEYFLIDSPNPTIIQFLKTPTYSKAIKRHFMMLQGKALNSVFLKRKQTDAPKRDLLEDLIHQAEDNIKINFE